MIGVNSFSFWLLLHLPFDCTDQEREGRGGGRCISMSFLLPFMIPLFVEAHSSMIHCPSFPFYHPLSLLLLFITQVLSLPLTLGGTCLYLSWLFTVRLPFSVYSSLPFIAWSRVANIKQIGERRRMNMIGSGWRRERERGRREGSSFHLVPSLLWERRKKKQDRLGLPRGWKKGRSFSLLFLDDSSPPFISPPLLFLLFSLLSHCISGRTLEWA